MQRSHIDDHRLVLMTGGVSGYGKVQLRTLQVSTGDGRGVRLG